jgi:hypothetical protein
MHGTKQNQQESIMKQLESVAHQVSFLSRAVERNKCECTGGLGDLLEGVVIHLFETKEMLEELWGMDEEEGSDD